MSPRRVILKEIGEIPTVPESQKQQELQLVLETRFKKDAVGKQRSLSTRHTRIVELIARAQRRELTARK